MKCQLCDGDGIVRNVTAALSGNDVCPHCHGSGLEPKGHDKQFDKRDQECWLIERFVNGHTEWFSGWANDAYGLNAGPSSEWVADVFKAVRFVRAEDARAVMQNQGERFHLSKPVAHLWFTPPQQEKVCWRKQPRCASRCVPSMPIPWY